MDSTWQRTEPLAWHLLKTFAFFALGGALLTLLEDGPLEMTSFALYFGGTMTAFAAVMHLFFNRQRGLRGVPVAYQRAHLMLEAQPAAHAHDPEDGAPRCRRPRQRQRHSRAHRG